MFWLLRLLIPGSRLASPLTLCAIPASSNLKTAQLPLYLGQRTNPETAFLALHCMPSPAHEHCGDGARGPSAPDAKAYGWADARTPMLPPRQP